MFITTSILQHTIFAPVTPLKRQKFADFLLTSSLMIVFKRSNSCFAGLSYDRRSSECYIYIHKHTLLKKTCKGISPTKTYVAVSILKLSFDM